MNEPSPASPDAFFDDYADETRFTMPRHEVEEMLAKIPLMIRSMLDEERGAVRRYLDEVDPVQGIDEVYDEIDLRTEVVRQIQMARVLQAQVIDAHGRRIGDLSPREAKEVMGATTTAINTVTKLKDTVHSIERQHNIERAVGKAFDAMGDQSIKDLYLEKLAEYCDDIS